MTTKLAKLVAADNKKFKKLSKQQQRIAIAKDALKIASRLQLSHDGDYFYFDKLEKKVTSKDFQQMVTDTQILKNCNVCALGGLMISAVRLNNRFVPEVYPNSEFCQEPKCSCAKASPLVMRASRYGSFGVLKALKRFFSEKQLDLIEEAFEGNDYAERPLENFKKIMANIIKNKGKFVASPETQKAVMNY